MYCSQTPRWYDQKDFLSSCLVELLLLMSLSHWGCFHDYQVTDNNKVVSQSKMRPIDVDAVVAERVGQEALENIGYDKIIKLAEKAGFVEYKSDETIQLVTYGSVVASASMRIFSRYAFAAAVTSQADSPLPGPADIAAVGIIVIGLVDAGLLDGYLLKSVGKFLVDTGEATLPATVATDVPDYRSDCMAHLTKCMETSPSRGRRGSGSHPGQSICADCFDQCNGYRRWPDKTDDGKDCQWWDGR